MKLVHVKMHCWQPRLKFLLLLLQLVSFSLAVTHKVQSLTHECSITLINTLYYEQRVHILTVYSN